MCDKTKTALNILLEQPDQGGLSKAAALVFQSVVGDTEKMEERMTKVEQRLGAVESKVDTINTKLDRVLQYYDNPSWFHQFWNSYGNKIVLVALTLIAGVVTRYALPEIIEVWKALI